MTVVVLKPMVQLLDADGKVVDGWAINSPYNCVKVCIYMKV